MILRGILLFSASVATALAVECFYKANPIPGTNYVELKSMNCEHGCCGTSDHQKCCDGLNWWMIFAFVLVGLFLIFVIIAAVFLIVKKKNKKKEQVGYTSDNPAYEDQPSTVDLSIFRTENSHTAHPPPYSFIGGNHNTHTAVDSRPKPTERNVRNEYLQSSSSSPWGDANPTSWRDSDFSYLDRYLERSQNAENERWNSPVEYSAVNRTGYVTTSSKLDAEFEVPLPYEHPDLTAECRYLGHTSEYTSESPTEGSETTRFPLMSPN